MMDHTRFGGLYIKPRGLGADEESVTRSGGVWLVGVRTSRGIIKVEELHRLHTCDDFE